ncbi:MAG TPA: sigma 54-interacting transcriptional regulator, partial [Lunatimonas sp.]|nr:sigma 54-interacting transcriptional regulator [Lunatimonas sp.]
HMPESSHTPQADRLIRYIIEHTQTQFGREYFRVLVRHLAEGLQVKAAWVTELLVREQVLRSLAFWVDGKYVDQYEYDLVDTPCERVVTEKECFLVPDKVIELFPKDPDLAPMNAVSYMGYPLVDENSQVIGHLAILHDAPLHPIPEQEAVFSLFVQRANAELLRLKAHEALQEKKVRLSTLIDSIHEAILEIDDLGFVTLANPAASRLFGLDRKHLIGGLVFSLFEEESAALMRATLRNTRENPDDDHSPGSGFELFVYHSNGETVPVKTSVCSYLINQERFLTLLLRDLKDIKRAEQRIKIMEDDTILPGKNRGRGLVGECKEIQKVIEDIQFISKSSSTVLLLGESGTGKEVFARYIHEQSTRSSKPMVIVNCAAIPSNLIESEFFGHEKGAFTGALQRREGRFSLADGGTLFLDEVGELPLDMQPKLLRVLQEGEFETIGGSRTIKVDVRTIAATNRNLEEMVREGTFREDLFYRLYVIPIQLPPLRKRDKDVILLADLFINKFSRQVGKTIRPLTKSAMDLLLTYHWPGNVRELQHVLERAVLLAKDEQLDLEKFIPNASVSFVDRCGENPETEPIKILSPEDLEHIEKKNLLNALNQTGWKISGLSGAAALLGIPPSTLNSKIKVFGLSKPSN